VPIDTAIERGKIVASNESVMVAFIHNKTAKSRNLTSIGHALINYQTVIAEWAGSVLLISTKKYSRTTSKIQSQLKNLCNSRGVKFTEVYSCE
jgi:hypothetical protein